MQSPIKFIQLRRIDDQGKKMYHFIDIWTSERHLLVSETIFLKCLEDHVVEFNV